MRDEIAASGETPLQYMLRVMRDPKAKQERRDEMAKAVAPYVHARLASVTANVNANVSGSVELTNARERLADLIARVSDAEAKTNGAGRLN